MIGYGAVGTHDAADYDDDDTGLSRINEQSRLLETTIPHDTTTSRIHHHYSS